jgi:VanZ family protein
METNIITNVTNLIVTAVENPSVIKSIFTNPVYMVPIAIAVLSEVMAFLPTKEKGIVKIVISVVTDILNKKSAEKK